MPLDLPVLLAAALAGLLGGMHCAVMCGGIAASFPAMAPRSRPLGVAWQANLGRVGGYVIAGALAGGIGGAFLRVARIDALAVGLRMAAGLALVLVALRLLDRGGRLDVLAGPGVRAWRWLQPLHRHVLPANTAWRRIALGALWGWMPCGLSTTLLAAAWLQASAAHGALTMAAFGLGTLPMMIPLTWAGARIGQRLQRGGLRSIAGTLVIAAGLLTLAGPWLLHAPVLHRVLEALGCRSLPA